MLRYTLFILLVSGSFATALAAVGPGSSDLAAEDLNVTVIQKNQDFPVFGPLVVEPCATEDCSDVSDMTN
jgi:hypothetical protein